MSVNPTLVPSFRFPNNISDSEVHPEVRKAIKSTFQALTDIYSAIPKLKAQIDAKNGMTTTSGGSTVAISPANTTVVPGDTPAVAHEWIDAYNAVTGASHRSQPAFSDISGIAAAAQIGTGTPSANQYVDGGTGAWTTLPGGGATKVPHVVTGSRSLGGSFQNTSGVDMVVSGYATTSGGGTDALQALIGTVSPSQQTWADDFTATLSSGRAGFEFYVPNGYFYELSVIPGAGGAITGLGLWVEFF